MTTRKIDLVTIAVVAICLAAMIVPVLCKAETPKENLSAKYLGLSFGTVAFFEYGAEQGYWMTNKEPKWDLYTHDNAHLHWFLQRGASLGSVLLVSRWHKPDRLLSARSVVQFVGASCFLSWSHNRGLRLNQTGKLFPDEHGHGFVIDIGFGKFEIKSSNELQWGMFGAGVVLLTLDALWDKL